MTVCSATGQPSWPLRGDSSPVAATPRPPFATWRTPPARRWQPSIGEWSRRRYCFARSSERTRVASTSWWARSPASGATEVEMVDALAEAYVTVSHRFSQETRIVTFGLSGREAGTTALADYYRAAQYRLETLEEIMAQGIRNGSLRPAGLSARDRAARACGTLDPVSRVRSVVGAAGARVPARMPASRRPTRRSLSVARTCCSMRTSQLSAASRAVWRRLSATLSSASGVRVTVTTSSSPEATRRMSPCTPNASRTPCTSAFVPRLT